MFSTDTTVHQKRIATSVSTTKKPAKAPLRVKPSAQDTATSRPKTSITTVSALTKATVTSSRKETSNQLAPVDPSTPPSTSEVSDDDLSFSVIKAFALDLPEAPDSIVSQRTRRPSLLPQRRPRRSSVFVSKATNLGGMAAAEKYKLSPVVVPVSIISTTDKPAVERAVAIPRSRGSKTSITRASAGQRSPASHVGKRLAARKQKLPTKRKAVTSSLGTRAKTVAESTTKSPSSSDALPPSKQWIAKEERAFQKLLNSHWLVCDSTLSLPTSPTANSLSSYTKGRVQHTVRDGLARLHKSQFAPIVDSIQSAMKSGRMKIRQDRELYADVGIRQNVINLLVQTYDLEWLQIALETIYPEEVRRRPNPDARPHLSNIITRKVLYNRDIALSFKHTLRRGVYREGFKEALDQHILLQLLTLEWEIAM